MAAAVSDLGERRYQAALSEWTSALDAWNNAGEPASGAVYDRMNDAREEFIEAQRGR